MSVGIAYLGRFGNHLFQYACARLFAERNGLYLETALDGEGVVSTTDCSEGQQVGFPEIVLGDGEADILDRDFPPARYIIAGYFQKASWYHPRRDRILEFILPTRSVGPKNTKDVVINIRLDDYLAFKYSPHPDWYLKVLEMEKFDRLHIVAEERHEKYLSYFKKYDPIIQASDKVSDFYYLQQFDRIVCANGTFSWWAAFMSTASKVYTHKRWAKPFPDADLSFFPNGVQVDGPFLDEKEL